jgi:hypothetical protein
VTVHDDSPLRAFEEQFWPATGFDNHRTAQLRRTYPDIDAVFAAKRRLDPAGRFSNRFWTTYGQPASPRSEP